MVLVNWVRPVMLFALPVMEPPNVNALMVVAVRAFTPVILLLPRARLPERLVVARFVVPVAERATACKPLLRSKLPAKELLPVLVPMMRPAVVRLPVAWIPLVVFKEPAKVEEPVPATVTLPPMDAYPIASKFVERDAAVIEKTDGIERTTVEFAPLSERVIWFGVPASALSKLSDEVFPNVINGISVSAPLDAVPVILPQEN